MCNLKIKDLEQYEELDENAMCEKKGGWAWSGLLLIPLAVGAGIRYVVDPDAYEANNAEVGG